MGRRLLTISIFVIILNLLAYSPRQASASPLSTLSVRDFVNRAPVNPAVTQPKPPPRPRPRPRCSTGQCPEAADTDIDEPEPGDAPETVEVDIPRVEVEYPKPKPEAKLKKRDKADPLSDPSYVLCQGEVCPKQAGKGYPAQECTHMAGRLFKKKNWTCCPKGLFADKIGDCCDLGDLTDDYVCEEGTAKLRGGYSWTIIFDL